jgi:hypothetical protein
MKNVITITLALLLATPVLAAQPFTGEDYSGIYDCTGDDSKEGKYTGTVSLQINKAQSSGAYGAYDFKLDVPGYGSYPGQAVSVGITLAMHFALTDQTSKNYGTGIAIVNRNPQGLVTFHKYYYEPEFKGGNHGFEDCVKR